MRNFTAMPKTPQFRQVIRDICTETAFVGLDEEGRPQYDNNREKPVVEFTGTVKLHGTNASIVINPENEIHCQSRKKIITPASDNAGFATQVNCFHDDFEDAMWVLRQKLIKERDKFPEVKDGIESSDITLYGEWCGAGVQKGVGISELPKMFVMFGVKVSPLGFNKDPHVSSYWITEGLDELLWNPLSWVKNIFQFQHWKLDIDFNKPEAITHKLADITNQVEEQCPVANAFGVKGIGEGVVWSGVYNGNLYRFKVKGKKHSVSKVKTLAAISPEKIESIDKFVEYACTRNRYDQCVQEVCGDDLDVKKTGDVIRWMQSDIIKEELDVLTESGLTMKDVGGKIAQQTRKWFMEDLNG